MLVFAQIMSSFTRNQMAKVQEFLAIFGEFLHFLCYFWLYVFYNVIIEKMQECEPYLIKFKSSKIDTHLDDIL